MDQMRALMDIMKPLLEFHGAKDEEAADDLRLFWDVRIVRGNGERWTNVSGSSTLPGALSQSRLQLLSTTLQDEIENKITAPLATVAQDYASAANLKRIDSECQEMRKVEDSLVSGQGQLSMAGSLAAKAEAAEIDEP